jgi:3-phenylpropionate/trans-cinnamate dioxygenase ferredoxin reductase component
VLTHYVIVGSSIAGLSAAETLRQRDLHALITMISEEAHEFYSRPGLAYLLRGDIPEKQLIVRPKDHVRALKLHRMTARVERLLCDSRELVLSGGKHVRYDRLLLATGSTAVPPPFPGGDLAGVVKLDNLDDTRHILKQAGRGRTAVVVGGGITALELAEGLHARGMRVHYFLRGARYWADVLDETESRIVQERLAHEGVTVHTNTQVKQAVGARGRLIGVDTEAGAHVPCDLLAVAIGVRPRVELAREAGLKVEKGVVVNEFLQTSRPEIFAAGDVAQVHDPRLNRATLDVLWSTALAQGQAAGANMAGSRRAYVKGISFNVTQLTGLKVTLIGSIGGGKDEDLVSIARGDSEVWRLPLRGRVLTEQDDVNRVRLLVGDKRIVGALVMGDQTWSWPLQKLVAGRVDISPIRSALVGDGAEALTRLARFYRHWEQSGKKR